MKNKKKYQKPEVEVVDLTFTKTVLGYCFTATSPTVSGACQIPASCISP
jgi:hypothetical protein